MRFQIFIEAQIIRVIPISVPIDLSVSDQRLVEGVDKLPFFFPV